MRILHSISNFVITAICFIPNRSETVADITLQAADGRPGCRISTGRLSVCKDENPSCFDAREIQQHACMGLVHVEGGGTGVVIRRGSPVARSRAALSAESRRSFTLNEEIRTVLFGPAMDITRGCVVAAPCRIESHCQKDGGGRFVIGAAAEPGTEAEDHPAAVVPENEGREALIKVTWPRGALIDTRPRTWLVDLMKRVRKISSFVQSKLDEALSGDLSGWTCAYECDNGKETLERFVLRNEEGEIYDAYRFRGSVRVLDPDLRQVSA